MREFGGLVCSNLCRTGGTDRPFILKEYRPRQFDYTTGGSRGTSRMELLIRCTYSMGNLQGVDTYNVASLSRLSWRRLHAEETNVAVRISSDLSQYWRTNVLLAIFAIAGPSHQISQIGSDVTPENNISGVTASPFERKLVNQ